MGQAIITIAELLGIAILVGWWLWQWKLVKGTKGWPSAEATIESGAIEEVARARGAVVNLPTFAFSYQVAGEYYSGRISLLPYITDPNEGLMARMIGHKLQIRYDPRHPQVWYVTDTLIEGCKVEQKIGPHLVGFYPKD